MSESGVVDVFFFVGPKPASVFHAYVVLTGMPALPPRYDSLDTLSFICLGGSRSSDLVWDIINVDGII